MLFDLCWAGHVWKEGRGWILGRGNNMNRSPKSGCWLRTQPWVIGPHSQGQLNVALLTASPVTLSGWVILFLWLPQHFLPQGVSSAAPLTAQYSYSLLTCLLLCSLIRNFCFMRAETRLHWPLYSLIGIVPGTNCYSRIQRRTLKSRQNLFCIW